MHLSEHEQSILLYIVHAANAASERTGHKGSFARTLKTDSWLTKEKMRSFLPFLDLFHVVISDNQKAIEKMTGVDADSFRREYLSFIDDCERSEAKKITLLEVTNLHERIKDELKDHKAEHKIKQRILYISDCHFYHDNLCRNLDHRGFIDLEDMNAFMIRQWNDNVSPKDDVYILGDFCFGNGEAAARIIKQLKGRLHLIIGNHDRFLHDRHFDRCLFKSIEAYSEISDKGRTVILSHYPVFCYKGQYRRNVDGSPATYMLYGHVHNTQDERLVNRFIMQTRATAVKPRNAGRPEPIPCNMINCFCMFSNYTPLTLDEWIDVDRERRDAMVGSGINTEV